MVKVVRGRHEAMIQPFDVISRCFETHGVFLGWRFIHRQNISLGTAFY